MKQIEKIDQQYLTCRTYGHPWQPLRVTPQRTDRGRLVGYHATLQCARCETERTQRLNSDGSLQGNTYRYPEGYLQKHGDDEVLFRRIDMRNEYIRRALGGAA